MLINDLDHMKQLIQLMEFANLAEATDVVVAPNAGTVILFSDFTKNHILKTHSKPGAGSIFASGPIPSIQKMLTGITPLAGTVAYTKQIPGIGYELVVTAQTAEKYQGDMIEIQKTHNGASVTVPAKRISEPLKTFSTDLITVILLPTDVNALNTYHADVKNDQSVLQAIQDKECFHVATAYPGNPNIPPASEWNGKYVVLIPSVAYQV
tara:strand:+ start:98 stop:724 length:627 start_codon:yes stop_codon:yes gene_type:complete